VSGCAGDTRDMRGQRTFWDLYFIARWTEKAKLSVQALQIFSF